MNEYIYDSLDKDDALIREYPGYEKETKENDIMAEVGGKIDVLDKGLVDNE